MTHAIPKNIFQVWHAWNTRDMPSEWSYARQSVLDMNPGWNHVLTSKEDDDRVVETHFPEFYRDTYSKFEYPIQRADAVRYVLLYLYGGIYMDLDYSAIRSFDTLHLEEGKEVGLISSHNTSSKFARMIGIPRATNSIMIAAKPGSQFWLTCIEEMQKPAPIWALTKHFKVMWSTGPWMVDRASRRFPDIVQFLDNVSVECSVCEIEYEDTCKFVPGKSYYVRPLKGSSWHSADSSFLNFAFCKWRIILFCIGLIIAFVYILKMRFG